MCMTVYLSMQVYEIEYWITKCGLLAIFENPYTLLDAGARLPYFSCCVKNAEFAFIFRFFTKYSVCHNTLKVLG